MLDNGLPCWTPEWRHPSLHATCMIHNYLFPRAVQRIYLHKIFIYSNEGVLLNDFGPANRLVSPPGTLFWKMICTRATRISNRQLKYENTHIFPFWNYFPLLNGLTPYALHACLPTPRTPFFHFTHTYYIYWKGHGQWRVLIQNTTPLPLLKK